MIHNIRFVRHEPLLNFNFFPPFVTNQSRKGNGIISTKKFYPKCFFHQILLRCFYLRLQIEFKIVQLDNEVAFFLKFNELDYIQVWIPYKVNVRFDTLNDWYSLPRQRLFIQ